MKNRMKLTDSTVKGLPLLSGTERKFVHDLGLTGLCLQVTTKAKSWYIYKTFEGRPLKYKLGEFPVMGADEARTEAIKVLGDLAKGIHPKEARRQVENKVRTFGDLFDRYLEGHLKPYTANWKEADQGVRLHCKDLLAVDLRFLARHDLQTWVTKIGTEQGKKQTADRVFHTIRACLRWGMQQELITMTNDPTRFVKLFRVKTTPVYLEEAQWEALKTILDRRAETDDSWARVRDIVHLALYTGARKNNVLGMRWDHLHLKAKLWIIPADLAKGRKLMILPLIDEAVAIIESRRFAARHTGFVFPSSESDCGHFVGIDKKFREVRDEAGLKIKFHSLRHTTGSWMGISGANAFDIQRQLGHASVATTQHYVGLNVDGLREKLAKAMDRLGSKNEQTA